MVLTPIQNEYLILTLIANNDFLLGGVESERSYRYIQSPDVNDLRKNTDLVVKLLYLSPKSLNVDDIQWLFTELEGHYEVFASEQTTIDIKTNFFILNPDHTFSPHELDIWGFYEQIYNEG